MISKSILQLLVIAATCTLSPITASHAAEEAKDGAAQPSTSSSHDHSPGNGPILPTYSHSNGQPAGPLLEPFDPNAPPRATIPIGPNLFVGGYTSLEGETNRHYDLSSTFGKADSTLTPLFAPAFAYEPNQYLQLYVNPVLEIPIAVEEIEDKSQTTELNMNLAYLTVKNVVPGARMQIGRQRFIDSRRWLFNENMDAIRLGYQYEQFSLELSVSQLNLVQRNLLRREAEEDEEGFVNYYAYADYKFGKKKPYRTVRPLSGSATAWYSPTDHVRSPIGWTALRQPQILAADCRGPRLRRRPAHSR